MSAAYTEFSRFLMRTLILTVRLVLAAGGLLALAPAGLRSRRRVAAAPQADALGPCHLRPARAVAPGPVTHPVPSDDPPHHPARRCGACAAARHEGAPRRRRRSHPERPIGRRRGGMPADAGPSRTAGCAGFFPLPTLQSLDVLPSGTPRSAGLQLTCPESSHAVPGSRGTVRKADRPYLASQGGSAVFGLSD